MPRFEKIPRENWQRARELRNQPTKAEQILWRALRGGQLGVRFLRQHPIGPFIVDFFAFDSKLVVEVDGDTHATPESIEYDKRRDAYLASQQITVKRYMNLDVLRNLDGVLRNILEAIEQPTKCG
jgi:very-short-patch-repair endonuclease